MARWEEFFDQHAPHYMANPFTQNTRAEVEFLLDHFQLPAGSTLLDIGCGVGRHAVAFAQRGWRVTGVDISRGMLAEAEKASQGLRVFPPETPPTEAGVRWIHADATTYEPDQEYDAVICLCEGGFGLADPDRDPIAHDLSLLKLAYRALRPNGPFVMTGLNGYALIRQMTDEMVQAGRFDPATMLAHYEDEWDLPEGKRQMTIRERLFIPPEVVAMLRWVGFEVRGIYGGTAGDWGPRPLKLDEVEVMFVCHKP